MVNAFKSPFRAKSPAATVRRGLGALLVLELMLAVPFADAATLAGHAAGPVSQRVAPPRLPIAPVRRPPATSKYTIHSDGAPSPSTYSSSYPVAFNNTGQIVGYGYDSNLGGKQDCIVYTGKKFVDFTTTGAVTNCSPNAINDEVAKTASLTIVGNAGSVYQQQATGFTAAINVTKPSATFNALTQYDPSGLTGVNASGNAIGTTYYNPPTGFFYSEPPAIYAAPTKKLSILQPSCSTYQAGCLYPGGNGPCAFGACSISNSNQVFGYDSYSGFYAVDSGGTVTDLMLPNSASSPFVLNNANQLLFSAYDSNNDENSNIYNLATNDVVTIPAVTGSSCAYYEPISMSDTGEVLGYAYGCSSSSPFYFTYDPTSNTTFDLNAELPMSSDTITPLGVNNKGQILAALATPSGLLTWGTLDPVPGARTRGIPAHRFSSRAASSRGR